MTTQQLHDAITLLPDDLILEADRRRNARRTIPFKRYGAMAAMFVLVLGCAALVRNLGIGKDTMKMAAAEAPAALYREDSLMEALEAAPAEPASDRITMDEAMEPVREAPAAQTAPTERNQNTASGTAEVMACTVTSLADGSVHILPESNTAVLQSFLEQLQFDPFQVCNCIAEYRLETDPETFYEINLTEGFVRTAQGQALLSELQTEELRGILLLEEVTP